MGRVSGSFAVNAFLGVPFAEPPTGPRRWSSPSPIRPWKGVRPAAQFAPNCMQLNPPAWSTMRKNVSEDCAPTARPPAAPFSVGGVCEWTGEVWVGGGGGLRLSARVVPMQACT